MSSPPVAERVQADPALLPGQVGAAASAGMPGSRRVAPQRSDASVQSFLAVEAFEVRHEVLVRLRDVAEDVELTGIGTLGIEEQGNVKDRLQAMVLPLATVAIDGQEANPIVDRVDFLTVGTQGVLPRLEPVPEIVSEAFIGVTVVYLTPRTPGELTLRWESFEGVMSEVPATVSDAEFSQTMTLTAEKPVLEWQHPMGRTQLTL